MGSDEVARLIEGDHAAVTAFTEEFLPRVYGLTLRLSRSREVADEATQETFVRALRALPDLEDPGRLAPRVFTIAANTVRELARKRKKVAPLDFEPPALEAEPDEESSRAHAIEHALGALEPPEREVFLLHTVEGVPLDDLALAHGTTPGAMKVRVHRIRSKVRVAAVNRLKRLGELS
jgi:RNA polymerase sigma-70 factor (ECF subfamily)